MGNLSPSHDHGLKRRVAELNREWSALTLSPFLSLNSLITFNFVAYMGDSNMKRGNFCANDLAEKLRICMRLILD